MKVAEGVVKKAQLLEAGMIYSSDHDLFASAERPTAGPDAGLKALFLRYDRYRVRTAITQNVGASQFQLKRMGDSYCVFRGESVFLRNVTLENPLFHTPNQAFINLASSCIFDCKYCATPKLKLRFKLEPKRVVELVRSALRRNNNLKAIALTSGVIGSERETIKLMTDTVTLIRKELGTQIPIGVEPFVTKQDHIDELYSAGCDEIKVNVESFEKEIVKAVCPAIDYDKVLSALEYSVDIFGKNRVCSNVLIGLGESNENVLNGLEWMAERGVVANLRPLLVNPYRMQDLAKATQGIAGRPSASRILQLALDYRSILNQYQLNTHSFKTMCHKCTGCEIVPQQDL